MNDKAINLRKRKPVLAIVGFLFLAVFSYFGYAIVTSQIAQTRVAEVFQPVEAIVLSSDVSSYSSGSLGGNSNRSYGVEIKYHYTVGSYDYRSHRYAYMSSGFKDYYEAKEVVDRYPAGERITVYYDPEKPADAVIYRVPPSLPPSIMAFPFVLFALIGLLLLIHGLRGTSAKRIR